MQREEIEKMAKEGDDQVRKDAKKMLEILDRVAKNSPQDWKTRRQAMYEEEKRKDND